MVASTGAPLNVIAAVKNYEWGIKGGSSLVGRLSAINSATPINEEKAYAELWMGTHPNGPSLAKSANGDASPLKEHLAQDLPFLFKVLSVAKALSIQAHPDADLAKKLHAADPKNYPDPNHKPEIAIALTPFEALCGFRPLNQICEYLDAIPEMAALVKPAKVLRLQDAAKGCDEQEKRDALKDLFSSLITAEPAVVEEQTKILKARLASNEAGASKLEKLCLRLNSEYPNEVGCFCVFLLNYMTLEEGEAIFMAANEPHAYLSGDCVECMALSDNVVRAGLTPKFRDVKTLLHMLTFKTYEPEQLAMRPAKLADRPSSLLYAPPVSEFAVVKISPAAGCAEKVGTESSDSLLLCVSGDLTLLCNGSQSEVKAGTILLLKKGSQCTLTAAPSASLPALLFQALSPDTSI